jgi:hypothetical protein
VVHLVRLEHEVVDRNLNATDEVVRRKLVPVPELKLYSTRIVPEDLNPVWEQTAFILVSADEVRAAEKPTGSERTGFPNLL